MKGKTLLLIILILLLVGFVARRHRMRQGGDYEPDQGGGVTTPIPLPPTLPSAMTVLTEDGGHVDWSETNNLIAFDRIGSDGYFDLWVMNGDGTNQRCLSCSVSALPKKHVGQPAWHPGGEYIVFQAEKDSAPKSLDNKAVPGAGVLNDLWMMRISDSKVWKIRDVSPEVSNDVQGILHSHFSHSGKKLLWVERVGGGKSAFGAWELKLADVSFDGAGAPALSNISTLASNSAGYFYESHGFSPDDSKVLYSSDVSGGLDIYSMDLGSKKSTQLTNSKGVWDEHAHYSPDGSKIIWASSQGLRFTVKPFVLETGFWIMDANGGNKKPLTFTHNSASSQYRQGFAAPADSSWSKDGKSFVGLVITGAPDTDRRGSGFIAKFNLVD